jgi:hypothetical protein
MSIETYEKLAGRLELYSLLLDDVRKENTEDFSDAMDKIRGNQN